MPAFPALLNQQVAENYRGFMNQLHAAHCALLIYSEGKMGLIIDGLIGAGLYALDIIIWNIPKLRFIDILSKLV